MNSIIKKTRDHLSRFVAFVGETKSEMKKVTWPDRTEVMNTTVVVILTSFFFGLFLFAVDVVIEYGVTFIRG